MNESKEHTSSTEAKPAAADDIVKDVGEVLVSTLRVGAALTRLVAKNTARGPLEEAPPGAEPVAAMVHYGSVTLKNMVGMVTSGVQFLKVQATPGGGDATASAAAPTHATPTGKPHVHQGATLRVPLSIENPGEQAMGPIVFQTRDVQYLGNPEAGVPLGSESVSFAPAELVIQPRDFEKLTVFVNVPPDAAAGAYRALVGSALNNFHATIEFEVLPAQ